MSLSAQFGKLRGSSKRLTMISVPCQGHGLQKGPAFGEHFCFKSKRTHCSFASKVSLILWQDVCILRGPKTQLFNFGLPQTVRKLKLRLFAKEVSTNEYTQIGRQEIAFLRKQRRQLGYHRISE